MYTTQGFKYEFGVTKAEKREISVKEWENDGVARIIGFSAAESEQGKANYLQFIMAREVEVTVAS